MLEPCDSSTDTISTELRLFAPTLHDLVQSERAASGQLHAQGEGAAENSGYVPVLLPTVARQMLIALVLAEGMAGVAYEVDSDTISITANLDDADRARVDEVAQKNLDSMTAQERMALVRRCSPALATLMENAYLAPGTTFLVAVAPFCEALAMAAQSGMAQAFPMRTRLLANIEAALTKTAVTLFISQDQVTLLRGLDYALGDCGPELLEWALERVAGKMVLRDTVAAMTGASADGGAQDPTPIAQRCMQELAAERSQLKPKLRAYLRQVNLDHSNAELLSVLFDHVLVEKPPVQLKPWMEALGEHCD